MGLIKAKSLHLCSFLVSLDSKLIPSIKEEDCVRIQATFEEIRDCLNGVEEHADRMLQIQKADAANDPPNDDARMMKIEPKDPIIEKDKMNEYSIASTEAEHLGVCTQAPGQAYLKQAGTMQIQRS